MVVGSCNFVLENHLWSPFPVVVFAFCSFVTLLYFARVSRNVSYFDLKSGMSGFSTTSLIGSTALYVENSSFMISYFVH